VAKSEATEKVHLVYSCEPPISIYRDMVAFLFYFLLKDLVDFRYRWTLSAGGPWASSSQASAGSHQDTLFPLESPPFTTITTKIKMNSNLGHSFCIIKVLNIGVVLNDFKSTVSFAQSNEISPFFKWNTLRLLLMQFFSGLANSHSLFLWKGFVRGCCWNWERVHQYRSLSL